MTLSGSGKVQVDDGTSRVLSPGDVMLADDLTGQGHKTGAEGDESWVFLSVQLP